MFSLRLTVWADCKSAAYRLLLNHMLVLWNAALEAQVDVKKNLVEMLEAGTYQLDILKRDIYALIIFLNKGIWPARLHSLDHEPPKSQSLYWISEKQHADSLNFFRHPGNAIWNLQQKWCKGGPYSTLAFSHFSTKAFSFVHRDRCSWSSCSIKPDCEDCLKSINTFEENWHLICPVKLCHMLSQGLLKLRWAMSLQIVLLLVVLAVKTEVIVEIRVLCKKWVIQDKYHKIIRS